MLPMPRLMLLAYVGLALVILCALLMPHLVVKYDSAGHIGAYTLLMVWPAIAIRELRKAIITAVVMVGISGVVEYLQRFSPDRSPTWSDFGMNTIGVITGLVIGLAAKRKLRAFHAA